MIQSIIEKDKQIYVKSKLMAELWGYKNNSTIVKYCKEGKVNAVKENNIWYISVNEPKPLTEKEKHDILLLIMQLKNNPNYPIVLNDNSINVENLYVILEKLVTEGFLEPFEKNNGNVVISEVLSRMVLTQQGFIFVIKQSNKKKVELYLLDNSINGLNVIASIASILASAKQLFVVN